MKPSDFLNEAIKAIGDRAAERDIDEERSAERAAHMFSALTGRDMTELEAWQFMCCLKLVRSATGKFKADDFVDLAGYAALAGEAAEKDSKELYPTWDMDHDCIRWTTSPGATGWSKEGNGGWIRHDGGGCPVHHRDMVEVIGTTGNRHPYPIAAWNVSWGRTYHYRPLRDSDSMPYCSAEGLPEWANYVATDECGMAFSYEFKPRPSRDSWMIDDDRESERPDRRSPVEFDNTRDHWTETLRRVYRREDV